jgi:hypothetical protein
MITESTINFLVYLVINFNRFLGDLVGVLISGGIFKCFRLSQCWILPENLA